MVDEDIESPGHVGDEGHGNSAYEAMADRAASLLIMNMGH